MAGISPVFASRAKSVMPRSMRIWSGDPDRFTLVWGTAVSSCNVLRSVDLLDYLICAR
jgi:hypothetical protein